MRPAAAASQSFSSSRSSRASFSFLSFFLSFLSSCGEAGDGKGRGRGFGVRRRRRELSSFSRLEPARIERARRRRGTDARAGRREGMLRGGRESRAYLALLLLLGVERGEQVRRHGSAHRARRGLLTSVGADGERSGEGRSLVARRRVEGFGSRRGDATVVTPRARSTSGAWCADGPRGVSRASRLNADRVVAAARKTKCAARRIDLPISVLRHGISNEATSNTVTSMEKVINR